MREERAPAELERRLSSSLHAAAPVAPPDLAERLLRRTAQIDQRRGWMGWSRMVPTAAAAAVVVVLAVVVGLQLGGLLPRIGDQPIGSSRPSETPSATGSPTPSPEASSSPSSTPVPSAEVFPGGASCVNETLGYAVSFPADWFANQAVEPDDPALTPVPACQYFGEEPLEIPPNAGLPPTVAIQFSLVSEEPPTSGELIDTESVTVAGRPATVSEHAGTGDGPFFAEGDFSYGYHIELPDGQVLIAATSSTSNGDYEGHKAVLDGMMQTLELIDS